MNEETTEINDAHLEDAPEQEASKGLTVSLAKANKLRNLISGRLQAIESQIAGLSNSTVFLADDYSVEDFEAARKAKIDEIMTLINHHANLNLALRAIKVAIGNANVQFGIADTMAVMEQLKIAMRPVEYLTQARQFDVKDVERTVKHNETVRRELSVIQPGTAYRPTLKTANYGLLHAAEVHNERVSLDSLKKSLREMEERRNELNYKAAIEIAPDFVELLKAHQII